MKQRDCRHAGDSLPQQLGAQQQLPAAMREKRLGKSLKGLDKRVYFINVQNCCFTFYRIKYIRVANICFLSCDTKHPKIRIVRSARVYESFLSMGFNLLLLCDLRIFTGRHFMKLRSTSCGGQCEIHTPSFQPRTGANYQTYTAQLQPVAAYSRIPTYRNCIIIIQDFTQEMFLGHEYKKCL